MNKWFKLALFSFIAIIILNLILDLFFGPWGFINQGGHMNYMPYGRPMHNYYQMPMH
ncbi:hypothetical protein SAMN02745885_01257 [Carboxydocella sporoproducens DSM 16521]|uniref:Uncharacterized protein n=2 Tax=Carboxydocella TaxID=178898 RepID=A0A1T4PFT5_9FIRM|nr:hypothetical protein CFE_2301 [Carboxydocella thermautotrophica]AVX31932.1 hypothetical protein CTH_2393 [Carboxydocella thermautotrophica]SJZ90339.1 hypothetical protein SAMN02745885_01257 [Carboxydocella sporoproducens DSM 16521]